MSNTAVAVHPEVDYAVVEVPDARPVLVATPLIEKAVGPDSTVLETVAGP